MPSVFFKPSWIVKLKGLSSQLGAVAMWRSLHTAQLTVSFRVSPEMDRAHPHPFYPPINTLLRLKEKPIIKHSNTVNFIYKQDTVHKGIITQWRNSVAHSSVINIVGLCCI